MVNLGEYLRDVLNIRLWTPVMQREENERMAGNGIEINRELNHLVENNAEDPEEIFPEPDQLESAPRFQYAHESLGTVGSEELHDAVSNIRDGMSWDEIWGAITRATHLFSWEITRVRGQSRRYTLLVNDGTTWDGHDFSALLLNNTGLRAVFGDHFRDDIEFDVQTNNVVTRYPDSTPIYPVPERAVIGDLQRSITPARPMEAPEPKPKDDFRDFLLKEITKKLKGRPCQTVKDSYEKVQDALIKRHGLSHYYCWIEIDPNYIIADLLKNSPTNDEIHAFLNELDDPQVSFYCCHCIKHVAGVSNEEFDAAWAVPGDAMERLTQDSVPNAIRISTPYGTRVMPMHSPPVEAMTVIGNTEGGTIAVNGTQWHYHGSMGWTHFPVRNIRPQHSPMENLIDLLRLPLVEHERMRHIIQNFITLFTMQDWSNTDQCYWKLKRVNWYWKEERKAPIQPLINLLTCSRRVLGENRVISPWSNDMAVERSRRKKIMENLRNVLSCTYTAKFLDAFGNGWGVAGVPLSVHPNQYAVQEWAMHHHRDRMRRFREGFRESL